MSQTDPVIIVGAGHNGLTAGAYLAKSGQKVLILESRDVLGGIAATETLLPGYHFNTGFSNTASYLNKAIKDLSLENYGFKQLTSSTALFSARHGGGGFALDGKGVLTTGGFAESQDGQKIQDFVAFFRRMSDVFSAMLPLTTPDIKGRLSLSELWPWAKVALKVKGLGERDMMDFIRILPMSAREFLDEWFEDDAILGSFALFSSIGAFLGPLGAGTTANFLLQFTGGFSPVFAAGGAGSLSKALARFIEANGGEIRINTTIDKVLVDKGQVSGVQTNTGEIIASPYVISSLDPAQTFAKLVGTRYLPVNFSRRLKNVRHKGSTATVHFALNSLPDFGVDTKHLDGWITICPDLYHLEKAYDDAKYGRISKSPALLAALPSISDPTLAPQGHHTMSVMVRYAPWQPGKGDYSNLENSVIETIESCAPGFKNMIVGQVTLSPHDYAQSYGLTEGAWMHGQMALDQLLIMRPIPGWAQYKTPIKGLFLCGSGSHPGGGITGAPGSNAAREFLKLIK